jgi:hypothetical protein
MENVDILKEVKPLLDELKRIQGKESEELVLRLEDKLEKKEEQLQLKNDQMKLEIHRLSGL